MKKVSAKSLNDHDFFLQYQSIANDNEENLLNSLKIPQLGYDDEQANNLLKTKTFAQIRPEKFSFLKEIFLTFINPFNLLLIFILVFQIVNYIMTKFTDSLALASAVIILIMMLLSAIISIVQNYKAFRTSKELQQLVKKTAFIIRNGATKMALINEQNIANLVTKVQKIEAQKIVPGDLIYLSTGDIVPCDVRILYTKNLLVNQSVLNGESTPAYKTILNNSTNKALFDISNFCFMGSSIVGGSAIGVVVNTGAATYLGAINTELQTIKVETNFNIGIKKVTRLIIIMILVMVPLVLVLNGVRTGQWLNAVVFAVSVAVGLTPESLPMIVAANLTKGSKRLAKQKVVIKQLDAVQNLGAIDVLCTDKTGTLTEDEIKLVNYYNVNKINNPQVLKYGYLNSYFQTGMRNQIDNAILDYKRVNYTSDLKDKYQMLDEIPFDFTRRKMSVLLNNVAKQEHTLISKGAVEEILAVCNYLDNDGDILSLDQTQKLKIIEDLLLLNQAGLRVIAIAYKNTTNSAVTIADEQDLVFLGFLCFTDVVKKDVEDTLKLLKKYGVTMKILTGDSPQVTTSVCTQIGLKVDGTLLGEEVDELSPEQLKHAVETTTIFAKLTPLQKAKVIDVLKSNKHKVGYMGDGINDALALRKSDVAISVNNATDIAKEASDIILLEKSLAVLEHGILEGRNIFGNIIKYLKVTIGANFGLMLSLLIASAWLAFSPMAPIQILFQNLLYDFSQVAVVFDKVDPDFSQKPRNWDTKGILSFTFWNGPSVTFISVLNFIVMGIILTSLGTMGQIDYNNPENVNLIYQFQTTMFTEGAVLHILMIFFMRTDKLNLFKNRPPLVLALPLLAIIIFVFALPFLPVVGSWIQLAPPPVIWYAYLAGGVLLFAAISMVIKIIYMKIYKFWL
ncbi:magnesium-translocating P-type ATPase [Spiroplasma chrysopicola]|uniref:Mg(2+) transport ATPase, P-type n=1 Tax=Spiroplasma chrysopicola DF-1 TaxID=1276227 RepID=R4U3V4_9MOLU|nr:magnesium-translocating P-type ATPase [Spiroplasma chrysopicola]AGM25183.1 Mg(2+) transport ATPase, P-type [Spiroplasma chrysopicola DF-1]